MDGVNHRTWGTSIRWDHRSNKRSIVIIKILTYIHIYINVGYVLTVALLPTLRVLYNRFSRRNKGWFLVILLGDTLHVHTTYFVYRVDCGKHLPTGVKFF